MRFPPYVRYVAKLPYNMQMTPTITVSDKIGNNLVLISTDHSVAGGDVNIRAEYVTKKGEQTYESLGWMNGQKIYIDVPRNVVVKEIKYRESGFDAEPSGKFSCDDGFYMTFWTRLCARFVNMRDNYSTVPSANGPMWGRCRCFDGSNILYLFHHNPSAYAQGNTRTRVVAEARRRDFLPLARRKL